MTTNDLQDISTLLEMGARLEAVKLVHPTTVSFQVLLTFAIEKKEAIDERINSWHGDAGELLRVQVQH